MKNKVVDLQVAVIFILIAMVVGGTIGALAASSGSDSSESGGSATSGSRSCLEALDQAEEGFLLAGQVMGHAQDGMLAASRFDTNGVEKATEDIRSTNRELSQVNPKWKAARDQCRESFD